MKDDINDGLWLQDSNGDTEEERLDIVFVQIRSVQKAKLNVFLLAQCPSLNFVWAA